MSLPEEALACAVSRYHFKPVVGEVVRILLSNPGSTLQRVSTLLSPFCEKKLAKKNHNRSPIGDAERLALARNSLAVLIQHGIVYSRELPITASRKPKVQEEDGAPSPSSQSPFSTQITYFVNSDDLLFRIRLPLFLGCARRSYGDVGEAAVRAIFERGRLSASHIFETALNAVLAELDITVHDAEACLCDMAKSGLLHWCGDRSFSHTTEVITNDTGTNMNGGSLEEVHVGKKRLLRNDLVEEEENYNSVSSKTASFVERITVGQGEHSREVGAPRKDNGVDIWGICFWHLNREFRIECCALMVQQRIKEELPVRVLRAGLQLALQYEDCEQPSEDLETADISTDSIQRQLEEQHGPISIQEFWTATNVLLNQSPPFAVAIPEQAPTSLRFIPGRLISETRQKTLEDLVMNRYGRVGHRVFRALIIEGGMEEKMIAEKCLLPLKVVREHLLNMYQDRVIQTQEVPRSNDQQRASNWYYLWIANPLAAYRSMLDVMYKTAAKLFTRLENLNVESAEGALKKTLQMHESLLTASILRMDQSIMVMRDFGTMTASYLPAKYRVVDGQIGKVRKGR